MYLSHYQPIIGTCHDMKCVPNGDDDVFDLPDLPKCPGSSHLCWEPHLLFKLTRSEKIAYRELLDEDLWQGSTTQPDTDSIYFAFEEDTEGGCPGMGVCQGGCGED